MHAPTVVVSRWPGETAWPDGSSSAPDLEGVDPARARELEDQLASALCARGSDVLVIPHVYYLSSDHPATERLRDLQGNLIVASWLSPRASEWVLRALGVGHGGRNISCVGLRGAGSADEVVDECLRLLGSSQSDPEGGPGRIEELADAATPRWYPVLDYSLCQGCGQCMDFCLFGVFTTENERVCATSPDNCKPGCPACARVCPHGAIMFPHYADDPAIAGALDAEARASAGSPDGGERADVDSDLDDLISALEQLDD